MNKEQLKVEEFHKLFNVAIASKPTIPDEKTCNLRYSLIKEEADELKIAMEAKNIVEVADALADLLYVVYGSAVTFGIDIEPIFDEVHRSNMTKVGGQQREDGKIIKPSTYEPANIKHLLEKQKWTKK